MKQVRFIGKITFPSTPGADVRFHASVQSQGTSNGAVMHSDDARIPGYLRGSPPHPRCSATYPATAACRGEWLPRIRGGQGPRAGRASGRAGPAGGSRDPAARPAGKAVPATRGVPGFVRGVSSDAGAVTHLRCSFQKAVVISA